MQLAYHEAGHAVIHCIYGDEVNVLSIDPPHFESLTTEGNPFKVAHTTLAGAVAEAFYLGLDNWYDGPGWEQDMDEVEALALKTLGLSTLKSGKLPKRAMDWVQERGEETEVMVAAAFPAVQRVAREVNKRRVIRSAEDIITLVYGGG